MELKNSQLARTTVSMSISSQSSTTTNLLSAAHGVSMYRSLAEVRMLLACFEAFEERRTTAAQSLDA
jgi:hypothetical protein